MHKAMYRTDYGNVCIWHAKKGLGYDVDMADWVPEEMVTDELVCKPKDHNFSFPDKSQSSLFLDYNKVFKEANKKSKSKQADVKPAESEEHYIF